MYNINFLSNNINGDYMIKDIMNSEIVYGTVDSTFIEISKAMKENNIGFIPIKENDEYVGVITDRDICLALPYIKSLNDSIKSYMSNNIVYVNIDESIDKALNIMSKNKIKRLLVKEKDNTVGVLSLSDILNYSNNTNVVNTVKTIFYIHDNIKDSVAEIDEFYL